MYIFIALIYFDFDGIFHILETNIIYILSTVNVNIVDKGTTTHINYAVVKKCYLTTIRSLRHGKFTLPRVFIFLVNWLLSRQFENSGILKNNFQTKIVYE